MRFRKTKIDWLLLGSLLLLVLYGAIAVYSATHSAQGAGISYTFGRQMLWIVLGLAAFALISVIPTGWLYFVAPWAYFFLLVVLLVLDLLPVSASATHRWLQIGSLQIQPSEFMKPALVLMLARYLSAEGHSPNSLRNLMAVFGLILLPFVLVLKQPDLGTSLTFLVLAVPMLYWRGLRGFVIFVMAAPFVSFIAAFHFWSFFVTIVLISLGLWFYHRGALVFWSVFTVNIAVGVLAPIFWGKLHTYQQQRILTFLGLVSDPKGVGYQIIQSKVAIGSGGLLGKGFLHGTQTQLRFLPAQHTDFIFSVLAEEWGFVGSVIVLLTFFVFLYRGISVAFATKNRFAALATIGMFSIFVFQVFVNIGMTLGIMPVTGLPLPFISYGGSSMISCMIMAGVMMNIAIRRYEY